MYNLTTFCYFLEFSTPFDQSSPQANAKIVASSLKHTAVIGSGHALDDLYLDFVSLFQLMKVPSDPAVENVLYCLLNEMKFTV